MPTPLEAQAALRRALAAGDTESAEVIRSDLAAAYEAEARNEYNPISEMSATDRVRANVGAGLTNVWQGVKQAALPEALEPRYGASEADVAGKRQIDRRLANSVEGGTAWQIAGEALPFFAVPAGGVARGMTAIPKVGNALAAAGVGSRVLPSMIAEGAAIGGAAGAAMPVAEGESRGFNALTSAVGGAAIPAAVGGLGRVYRSLPLPGSRGLQERAVSRTMAREIPAPGRVAKDIDRALRAPRVTETPSTAVLLQDPRMASTELAYRAMPEFSAGWQQMDDAANRARWDALDSTLGSTETVQAAREVTDAYKRDAFPKFLKSVNRGELNKQSIGFESAVQARLNSAIQNADENAQQVYGYIMQQKQKGARFSPQSLWNIRQTLKSWIEGVPPAGYEGTRGAKIDRPIKEVTDAIDSMLNTSSGNQWRRFLDGLAENLQKETTQKAGQNIRNAFVDEALGFPRKPTRSGAPDVTPAALKQAFSKFGKNDFGPTLDWPQEDAVRQVMGDLGASDILAGAKKSATGGGGSQTAPLAANLLRQRGGDVGGSAIQVMREISRIGEGRQREIINQMLQDPAYARELLRLAADQSSPLTRQQRQLVAAARLSLIAPAAGEVSQ